MNYPKMKEKSDRIKNLQKALNAFDAGLDEDGYYGELTREALNKLYLAKEEPIIVGETFKDMYTAERIKHLHPKVQDIFAKFILEAEATLGITLRITQGFRTFKEQDALYAQGRTTKGPKVTNAKGGQSYHNYGLAIDLVRMDGPKPDWNYDMAKLLPLALKHGIAWGGSAAFIKAGMVDKPHFEIRFGYNWRDLLKKYMDRDVDITMKYVNL